MEIRSTRYRRAPGTQVSSVLVDGVSVGAVSSYTFSNVQADHTISVHPSPSIQYTITVTRDQTAPSSPAAAPPSTTGRVRPFTITPSTGYSVSSVVVDGSSVGVVSSYTFSNVQAAHTITASYAINTYAITVTQGSNGVIAPGTTTVNYGGEPMHSRSHRAPATTSLASTVVSGCGRLSSLALVSDG